MTTVQLGVGTHPTRVDLLMRASEPFEYFLPVLDALGVGLDQTSWTVTCSVRSADRSQALTALTVDHELTGLTVRATAAETTAWAATWPTYVPWILRSVHPAGDPLFSVAGWVSIYR